MAVQMYKTDSGQDAWKVYVNVRSKVSPSVRAQRRISGFETLREAEREELRLVRQCEREILEKESQGESWGTLMEAYQLHLDEQVREGEIQATTSEDTMTALRKHTSQWWSKPASAVIKLDVRELLNQMKAHGYSNSHQRRLKVVINRAFEFGVENRMIPSHLLSPALGIEIRRDEEKKPEILTLSEIRRLLEAAKTMQHDWYPIWSLALLTGMRNGELYALEWGDVDFENNKISVNKSFNGRLKALKSTKAGYWRAVPISSELRTLLTELKADAIREHRRHVLPRLSKWQMGLQAEELRAFCSSLNIPSVRFHALRACFATQLIRNGVPPIQIQKICGWKDLKTMQRYIRLAGIEIDGATEVLKVLPDQLVMQNAATEIAGAAKQVSRLS